MFTSLVESFLVEFVGLFSLVFAERDVSSLQIGLFCTLRELFYIIGKTQASCNVGVILRLNDRTEGRSGFIWI